MYIDKKSQKSKASIQLLELNQINYLDMVMVHLMYWFVKMFLF